jgi:hypothetical protein
VIGKNSHGDQHDPWRLRAVLGLITAVLTLTAVSAGTANPQSINEVHS